MAKKKGNKQLGAPSKFSIELFEKICNDISYSDKGLVSICKENGINASSFYKWITGTGNKNLIDKYASARELQADYLADQIIYISDDKSQDVVITENGISQNSEFVNRSRLRIDARKWKASKLYPKKYGDKTDVDVTTNGKDISIPITTVRIVDTRTND